MDRVGGGDLGAKLLEIMSEAEKHGFGEKEIKLAALKFVKDHRNQDNYDSLKVILVGNLAAFGYAFTADEQREILHNNNLDYHL